MIQSPCICQQPDGVLRISGFLFEFLICKICNNFGGKYYDMKLGHETNHVKKRNIQISKQSHKTPWLQCMMLYLIFVLTILIFYYLQVGLTLMPTFLQKRFAKTTPLSIGRKFKCGPRIPLAFLFNLLRLNSQKKIQGNNFIM